MNTWCPGTACASGKLSPSKAGDTGIKKINTKKTDNVTDFNAICLSFQRQKTSQSCRKPVVKRNCTHKLCFRIITCSRWPMG